MTDEATLVREKLDQVPAILEEHGIDLWLTFVHETQVTPDPCMELIVGTHCTWQSAFLLSRSGQRQAIVGRFDAPGVEQVGGYSDIVTYDESVRPVLREAIARLDPPSIALNYAPSDPAADGLTHGMWLVLRETLEGTPYADRLVSSAPVVGSLRGRKTSFEIERIRAAIAETEEIFALVRGQIRPGLKETEIAAIFHEEVSRRGLGYAWEEGQCPALNAGPEKEVGHTGPTGLDARHGHLIHTDFGVQKDGYCSDLQRMWYLLDEGESEPPAEVVAAWGAIWASMDTGAAVLRPESKGTRSTRRRVRASSLPATTSRSTRSGTSWGGPPTTAERSSPRSGTGSATLLAASSRKARSTPSSTARRSKVGAISGSRKTCSSPRTATSG